MASYPHLHINIPRSVVGLFF